MQEDHNKEVKIEPKSSGYAAKKGEHINSPGRNMHCILLCAELTVFLRSLDVVCRKKVTAARGIGSPNFGLTSTPPSTNIYKV